MLLTKEVEVTLCGANILFYENLKYDIPRQKDKKGRMSVKRGTKITVKIEDLKDMSHEKIKILCDYCLEDGIETVIVKSYGDYTGRKNVELIKKDCCKICLPKKNREVCLEMYGVERYSQVPEIKEKIAKAQNHSYEFIESEFTKMKLILITKEYINNSQELEYLCKKHIDKGVQKIMYLSLKNCKFGCHFCDLEYRSEIYRHDYIFVKSKFEEKNLELLEDTYLNENTNMKFRCNFHTEEIQEISFGSLYHQDAGCYSCSILKRSGENHWNWRGGICPLTSHLRQKIEIWKKDSMRNSNFKCVITDERFDIVHHLYGFNEILQETLTEVNLPALKNINQYTPEELLSIEEKFLEIHFRYPLGVCLKNSVHDLFHSIYDFGGNTPEQFYEFKENYLNGFYLQQVDNKSAS